MPGDGSGTLFDKRPFNWEGNYNCDRRDGRGKVQVQMGGRIKVGHINFDEEGEAVMDTLQWEQLGAGATGAAAAPLPKPFF